MGESKRAKRNGIYFGYFSFQLVVMGVCAVRGPERVVPGKGDFVVKSLNVRFRFHHKYVSSE